jgi:hypothetical protein
MRFAADEMFASVMGPWVWRVERKAPTISFSKVPTRQVSRCRSGTDDDGHPRHDPRCPVCGPDGLSKWELWEPPATS